MVFIPSPDIRSVVIEKYGINPSLIRYEPLGVNEEWFHYPTEQDRINAKSFLKELGIPVNKKIVVYAGKLNSKKGADLVLAAISRLRERRNDVVGLFIGEGNSEFVKKIKGTSGCFVIPKTPASLLSKFYWASDLGVWAREGSTSILDAIASGLPTVVRSGLTEPERRPFERLVFEEDNLDSLVRTIEQNLDSDDLSAIGQKGSEMLLKSHKWSMIAKKRAERYFSLIEEMRE